MGTENVTVIVAVLAGDGKIVVVVTMVETVVAPSPAVGTSVIAWVNVDVIVVRGMGGYV